MQDRDPMLHREKIHFAESVLFYQSITVN